MLEISFLTIQENIHFSVETYQHKQFLFTPVSSYVTMNFSGIIAVKHVPPYIKPLAESLMML